jgi:glutathione peroxidase-family protein
MIRAIVTPQNQDISIHVPENYVGRELEVLLFPTDELTAQEPSVHSVAAMRGSLKLSDEELKDFREYHNDVLSD